MRFEYERFEKAVEGLNREIDIVKHVSTQRLSEFMAKLTLRRHHRALVSSFMKYQIDNMLAEEEEAKKNQMAFERLAQAEGHDVDLFELVDDDNRYSFYGDDQLT